MPLKHGLLGLINYQSKTGYELNKAFEESLNFFWKAQTSQIYRELNKMEKESWLVSETIIQIGKPNKKVYSITGAGQEELNRWLRHHESMEWVTLRSEFLMKLFLSGGKLLEENIEYLKQYRNECRKLMKNMEATGEIIERQSATLSDRKDAFYWELTADYGFDYYTMCLNWATKTINKLEEKINEESN